VWWFVWLRRAELLRSCCAESLEQRVDQENCRDDIRSSERGLAVAVLAAGVGVGRGRVSAGSVGLEGSGVTFDELIKPADDGELR
jgi:hypothetical protein